MSEDFKIQTADEFCDEHAIREDVYKDRYLVWWPDAKGEDGKPIKGTGNMQPLIDAYTKPEPLNASQRGFMTRMGQQVPGRVIVRHAPAGLDLPHVYPEVRPESGYMFKTAPTTTHWHGYDESTRPPTWTTAAGEVKPLTDRHVLTGHGRDEHVKREKFLDDHHGANTEDRHTHEDLAKYIFPPKANLWEEYEHSHDGYEHSHEEYGADDKALVRHLALSPHNKQTKGGVHVHKGYRDPEKRREHVNMAATPNNTAKLPHDGDDVTGLHVHRKKTKQGSPAVAQRIDMHPMAEPLFKDAVRVYFSIEGSLKNDAILSAILVTGEPSSVFCVPSVTLWEPPRGELQRFARRYLQDKQVVIVPDADWYKNNRVIRQARFCQSVLWDAGANAIIAAAPKAGLPKIKGVDDFLADGGTLAELEIIERKAPYGYAEFVTQRGTYKNRMTRNTRVLRGLIMHADPDGGIKVPYRTLARIVGVSKDSVGRAIQDLEVDGCITVEGNISTRQHWVPRRKDGTGGFYTQEQVWKAGTRDNWPTIWLHPDLRGEDIDGRPLGKPEFAT